MTYSEFRHAVQLLAEERYGAALRHAGQAERSAFSAALSAGREN